MLLQACVLIYRNFPRAQWRSEGNWHPGANLNFAPPPQKKKFLKNDNKLSSIQLNHVYNYIGVGLHVYFTTFDMI